MNNGSAAVQPPVRKEPRRHTVLFVDDEARVLKSMRAMFRRQYNVLMASSGQEALDVLAANHVDVIVSDQRMPGMTGVEVLSEVKARAPQAMRILLTGYADLEAVEASINEGEVFRYLTKPCPSDQLKEAVGLAAEIAAQRKGGEKTGVDGAGDTASLPSPSKAASPSVTELIPLLSKNAGSTAEKQGVSTSGAVARESAPVDVLVLSNDQEMSSVFQAAVDGRHVVHLVETLDAAIDVLEQHPVGVLITDRAADEAAIGKLTTALKQRVPELVSIVASARSDAQMLIDLINYGQIFRFLLKPLRAGQCRLSLEAAVTKHRQLMADPTLSRRHIVETRPEPEDAGVLGAVFSRLRAMRSRLFAAG